MDANHCFQVLNHFLSLDEAGVAFGQWVYLFEDHVQLVFLLSLQVSILTDLVQCLIQGWLGRERKAELPWKKYSGVHRL